MLRTSPSQFGIPVSSDCQAIVSVAEQSQISTSDNALGTGVVKREHIAAEMAASVSTHSQAEHSISSNFSVDYCRIGTAAATRKQLDSPATEKSRLTMRIREMQQRFDQLLSASSVLYQQTSRTPPKFRGYYGLQTPPENAIKACLLICYLFS